MLGYLTGLYQNAYRFLQPAVGGTIDYNIWREIFFDIFSSLSRRVEVVQTVIEYERAQNLDFQRGEDRAEKVW